MTSTTEYVYGAELISFSHPSWWGLSDESALARKVADDPRGSLQRVVDTVHESGARAIELTFAPVTWRQAKQSWGDDLRPYLDRRGLFVHSSFLLLGSTNAPDHPVQIRREVGSMAAFLSELGGRFIVIGAPARRERGVREGSRAAARETAEFGREMAELGKLCAQQGVKLLVHTEAHSLLGSIASLDVFCESTSAADVGVCVDSAQLFIAGEDPAAVVRRFVDRVELAHWKDASGAIPVLPLDEKSIHEHHLPLMCDVGSGNVDWTAWAAALEQAPARTVRMIESDASLDPAASIRGGILHAESLGI